MWPSITLFSGLAVYLACVIQTLNACDLPRKGNPNFPKNFSFGVATSAYQVEGGWDADGKGPSIWDDFTHNHAHRIIDGSTGDISADSYHQFDSDLAALKELNVNHYRFSISWPRIFPNGDISSRNQKGIDYYNNVINKLLANGIEPMVTMFHYDLPSEIQKIGGFANELFIRYFVVYAAELFEQYGDRVKKWMTFNEPLVFCKSSYADARYPPLVSAPGVADYLCVDHTIKAHAATYKLYKSKYFKKQGGKIGMALDSYFYFPRSKKETAAAHRGLLFNIGFLGHPIYHKSGGYPEVMVNDIEQNSLNEGRRTSRLPQFAGYWKEMVTRSADFFALNHYTSRLLHRTGPTNDSKPSWEHDMDCTETVDPTWLNGKAPWLYCVPEGLEGMLKFIRDEYDNVEVIITENGWGDDGDLDDDNRIRYLKSYLQATLNAINDGCNVTGYTYWSLVDNFEWANGYSVKFGLYSVDMTSPKRERTPRKSAGYYKRVIKAKKILNQIDLKDLMTNQKTNTKR